MEYYIFVQGYTPVWLHSCVVATLGEIEHRNLEYNPNLYYLILFLQEHRIGSL